MQSMHRHLGKFMKRSADESQVSVLLKDFDEADKLLAKIIEDTKAWRDAWTAILTYQGRLIHEFEGLYAPILGNSDASNARPSVATPETTLARTNRLYEEYESLRKDLLEEVSAVDDRMIQPAQQVKELLVPLKKTIKKREDKKLDFEHFQSRFDNSQKKTKRSDRDNAVLAKAEMDLAKAKEEYNAADDHLRENLPPLIAAVFSLLPLVLAAQIQIQNSLLANYYTVLHTYCEEEQFPSPPPPMEQVIQDWKTDFLPIQQEVEGFGCIANGKAIRQSMNGEDKRNGSSTTTNGFGARRPSYNRQTSTSTSPGHSVPPPAPVMGTKPRLGDYLSTTTTSTGSSSSSNPKYNGRPTSNGSDDAPDGYSSSPMPVGYSAPKTDYFSRERRPSSSTATTPGAGSSLSSIAAKKRPPPPPPRANSGVQAAYVTALYDFGGQGAGDLVFREGDRIRVLKKTDSTDDWWEGELRGTKGSFPANYCR